ncbi:MAG TPA: hypothetical protein VJN93_14935 [Candidatus Acidoferrum sp.]|nr:hypothetical protein [Candidatus Acidoferrum sp.]
MISFAAVNNLATSGQSINSAIQPSAANSRASLQASASQLQIAEVQLTLANANGQTAQVRAIPRNGPATTAPDSNIGTNTRTRAARAQ